LFPEFLVSCGFWCIIFVPAIHWFINNIWVLPQVMCFKGRFLCDVMCTSPKAIVTLFVSQL
jgi:hypothetical protein